MQSVGISGSTLRSSYLPVFLACESQANIKFNAPSNLPAEGHPRECTGRCKKMDHQINADPDIEARLLNIRTYNFVIDRGIAYRRAPRR